MFKKNKKFIGLCVCILIVSLFFLETMATEVLTVSSYGGPYDEAYKENLHLFEKENDVKVEFITGGGADILARARFGQVDVLTTAISWSAFGESEGLFLELNDNEIPNMKNLYDMAKLSKYSVIANVGDYGIVYNNRHVKEPPSWEDLWDPKYKDRVALFQFLHTGTLHLVIYLAEKEGGGVDNIKPGLEKLAELYSSGNLIGMVHQNSEMQGLLEVEEAWLAMLPNGRMLNLWEKGLDFLKFSRPEAGTPSLVTTLNIAKTTNKPELAKKFVNYALSPECQEAIARKSYYSPTVNNANIPSELKVILVPVDELEKLWMPDWFEINKYKDDWVKQWERMIIN